MHFFNLPHRFVGGRFFFLFVVFFFLSVVTGYMYCCGNCGTIRRSCFFFGSGHLAVDLQTFRESLFSCLTTLRRRLHTSLSELSAAFGWGRIFLTEFTSHAGNARKAQSRRAQVNHRCGGLAVDFWTLKRRRKIGCSCLLTDAPYKLCHIHEGCVQGQHASQEVIKKPACEDQKRTQKDFPPPRENVFIDLKGAVFFSQRNERIRWSSLTKTAVFFRLAAKLLSFVK